MTGPPNNGPSSARAPPPPLLSKPSLHRSGVPAVTPKTLAPSLPSSSAALSGNAVMDNLIPVINKLQDAFASVGLAGLDLPQIAVVGAQSSGKSSVLESIVGRDFLPRGSGIVTRRPLVLQLINQPKGSAEYGVFLHQSSKKFYDFAEIRQEIQAETDRTTGNNKGISASPINLKIYSPNVIDLTLIDLPGVTKVPVGDQPADIETLIRDMVLQYIEKESCLVLAVTPANSDIANSDALQLARLVDPDGHRTIGVLTKLDLMDEGTDALDILNNEMIQLRHGFVGVVNRSQKEIVANKDVVSALEKEAEWFSSHPVYRVIKDRSGTAFLREKLRGTLIQHIKRTLPELKHSLTTRLGQVKKELDVLNSPFDSINPRTLGSNAGPQSPTALHHDPANIQRALLNIVQMFTGTIKLIIDGHDGDIKSDAFGALSFITGSVNPFSLSSNKRGKHRGLVELNVSVRIKYVFWEKFPKTLMKLEDVLLGNEMDNELRAMIHNARGLRAGLFVPDAVLEILIKRHILQLEPPALQCVDSVTSELVAMIDQILCSPHSPINGFPLLGAWIKKVANRTLQSCREETVAEVKRLIQMETAYINTGHPDFLARNGIANFLAEQQHRSQNGPPSPLIRPHGAVAGRKRGYLTKMGGSRKSWKLRYFTLQDATLTFREDENDSQERGSFPLLNCLVRDLSTRKVYPDREKTGLGTSTMVEEQLYRDRPFAFEIFSSDGTILLRNHRNLVVCAENEKEKLDWIRLIADSINWARDRETVATSADSDPKNGNSAAVEPARKQNNTTKPAPIRNSYASSNGEGLMSPMPDQMYATDLSNANRAFVGQFNPVSGDQEGASQAEIFESTDENTIAMVRMLLHSYFMIVRKHIQDLVPKAIMLMMISRLKSDLNLVLTEKILFGDKYKDEAGNETTVNVLDLLEETEETRQLRQSKSDMVKMLRLALNVLEKDIGELKM